MADHATAQTFSCLYSFSPTTAGTNSDGADPFAGVIALGNTLYGTTTQGGTNGNGSIFSIQTDGTHFATLHDYAWPPVDRFLFDSPQSGLVLAGNTLYGAEIGGGTNGNGAIISLNTNGLNYSTLYHWSALSSNTNSDGRFPGSTLVLSGGTFFGTANEGGVNGQGTIFRINEDGTDFTNLHSFTGQSDGGEPGGLILSGNIVYGTAAFGGTNNTGTVFKVNTDGTDFSILHTFATNSGSFLITNADGAYPYGALVLAGSTLYGSASEGGTNGTGTIFAVSTNGARFSVLHNFSALNSTGNFPSPSSTNADGADPTCTLLLSGQFLYGTTHGGGPSGSGTVFEVSTNDGSFEVLHSFSAANPPNFTNADGADPQSGLIISGNTLYGTTYGGGTNGLGTLFSLLPAQPPIVPVILSSPQSSFANANFSFLLSGSAGSNYVLLISTNLMNWSPMFTSTIPVSGSVRLTNTSAGSNQRFYRAILP